MNIGKDIAAKVDPACGTSTGVSFNGLYELTKPRLSLLSVFTASLGYLVYDPFRSDFSIFICLTFGTALSAGGAAVLNQWMERKEDALMARTRNRPIPAKVITPGTALFFGTLLCMFGFPYLNFWNQSMGRHSYLRYHFDLSDALHTFKEENFLGN